MGTQGGVILLQGSESSDRSADQYQPRSLFLVPIGTPWAKYRTAILLLSRLQEALKHNTRFTSTDSFAQSERLDPAVQDIHQGTQRITSPMK